MSLLLLLTLLLLYATHHSVVVLASAQTISTSSTTEDFGIDLYSLSDMELEEICTIRGFELVQEVDDATGEQYVFTHEDYVEAAKQCLAIERDMEEIIAEHPEILSELEAERDRMMDEKEKLEKQLQEAKQKDQQQSLLEEEEEEVHAAFVTKPKTTTTSSEASAPVKEPKQKTTTTTESPATKDDKEPQSSTQLEQQQQQPSSPLSLPELVKSTMLEFRERVQRDVQKLYDMALPASIREPLAQTLRPLWTIAKQLTKDVTKFLIRHVRALVKQTTEQLKERKERRRQAAATSEGK